jgi:hypothetical protein
MVMTTNYYPEFPVIPYQRTTALMSDVIAYAKTLINEPIEVIKSAYEIFRIEGGNGKDGINNNYGGIEADCGRWTGLDLTHVIGTCIKFDGKAPRMHICFNSEFGFNLHLIFL